MPDTDLLFKIIAQDEAKQALEAARAAVDQMTEADKRLVEVSHKLEQADRAQAESDKALAESKQTVVKAIDESIGSQEKYTKQLDELQRQYDSGKISQDQFSEGLKKLKTEAETAGDRLEKTGKQIAGIGEKMTIGITVPLVGLSAVAAKFASDLGETRNKIDVLFGESSKDIQAWAATAATALGQSQKQALDAASTFAVFGKSAGLAGKDLTEFSEQNVKLASDMASFFNTSPEDAIQAIGAAFRGESEPIRRYGVLIDEASLKNEAVRLGLIRTTKDALEPQQRVLAAQALILQQTGAAQGDFARTSDGLANSTRIAKAELENTLATLGEKFLPLALKGTQFVTGLLEAFQKLPPPMQDAIIAFGGLAAAAGPVLTVGGKLISTYADLAGKIPDLAGKFSNLSNVLKGMEFGVIIAGLIAIAKYLEEVGNASKATSEDLIAMSRSGDVFKQAAATTVIAAEGQNRLKTALDGTHEKIREGAKNYADYKSSIDATAKAAGYQIDAQGNLITVMSGSQGRIEKVVQANYALSESQYNAARMVKEFSGMANDAGTALGRFGGAASAANSSMLSATETIARNKEQIGDLQQKIVDLTDKGFEPESKQIQLVKEEIERLTKANEGLEQSLRNIQTALPDTMQAFQSKSIADAAESIEVLKIAMGGAVTKEMEAFKNKQDELTAKAAELQNVISTSYGQARDDAIKSLGEINKELGANAQAHAEATKRILFDIAAQQLATIQDPTLRAKAMNELALQWGLVDKATYEATQKIIGYTDQLANDKNIEAYRHNLGGIADEALGLPKVVENVTDNMMNKSKDLANQKINVPVSVDKEGANKSLEDTQNELRDKALGREIVIPVVTKVSTVTVDEDKGDRDKQVQAREESATSRARSAVKSVGDSSKEVITTLADTQQKATDRVQQMTETTKQKALDMSGVLTSAFNLVGDSVVTAMSIADSNSSSTVDNITRYINSLPTYKEFIYHIKVTGDEIPDAPRDKDFPSRQHGGPIRTEGLYYLHPDEYVLSASMRRGAEHIPAQAAPALNQRGGDTVINNNNFYDALSTKLWQEKQRLDRVQSVMEAM